MFIGKRSLLSNLERKFVIAYFPKTTRQIPSAANWRGVLYDYIMYRESSVFGAVNNLLWHRWIVSSSCNFQQGPK